MIRNTLTRYAHLRLFSLHRPALLRTALAVVLSLVAWPATSEAHGPWHLQFRVLSHQSASGRPPTRETRQQAGPPRQT
jgi:hypothetical protein